jgi:putative endonuclease
LGAAGEGSPRSDSVCGVGEFWQPVRSLSLPIVRGGCISASPVICARRLIRAPARLMPGFTSKYFLERLVYFEETDDVGAAGAAIAREKELKGGRRSKKIALMQKVNPQWSDLSRDLIE